MLRYLNKLDKQQLKKKNLAILKNCLISAKHALRPTYPVVLNNGINATKCYDFSNGHFGWCGTNDHLDDSTPTIQHDSNWGYCMNDCDEM